MNPRPLFRLLAVVLVVSSGVRLLAETDPIVLRSLALDLLQKQSSEASDRDELRAARQGILAQAPQLSAANFDLNKNGRLEDAEFAAFAAATRQAAAKAPEALKRFDRNGDGKLDDAEWTAASNVLFGRR